MAVQSGKAAVVEGWAGVMPRGVAWKCTEREIAKRLGGKRQPITGRRGADVLHEWLAIECKERKALPKWLLHAIEQAVAVASEAQLPVVILHQLGARHDGDLVCIRLRDFQDWYGEIEKGEEA